MSRYEILTTNEKIVLKFLANNLMPVHILDWKVYYEAYLVNLKATEKESGKPRKNEAIETVAAHYDISRRTMYAVIAFMECAD